MTSRPPPRTRRTLLRPSVRTSRNSISDRHLEWRMETVFKPPAALGSKPFSKISLFKNPRHLFIQGYSFRRPLGSSVVPACWARWVWPPWISWWWPRSAALLCACASRRPGFWKVKENVQFWPIWFVKLYFSCWNKNRQNYKIFTLTNSPIHCSMIGIIKKNNVKVHLLMICCFIFSNMA